MHTGYQTEECERKDKFNRNLNLLLAELEKQPDDVYFLYQIGKTYFSNKQYDNALTYLQTALNKITQQNLNELFLPDLLTSIAYCLIYLKEWEALDDFISEAIRILPNYTDLYFAYGVGLIEQQNPAKVELIPSIFKTCLTLGEPDSRLYDTTQGVGSYLANYNLGIYYEVLGQPEQAKLHYTDAFPIIMNQLIND